MALVRQPEVSAMSDRASASSRTDGDSTSGITYLRSKRRKVIEQF